jgi:hypothetical protein
MPPPDSRKSPCWPAMTTDLPTPEPTPSRTAWPRIVATVATSAGSSVVIAIGDWSALSVGVLATVAAGTWVVTHPQLVTNWMYEVANTVRAATHLIETVRRERSKWSRGP